ncbi:hypothetical protein [Spiroplasma endosymbiont of Colias croceus]|uniref:hypothetical protein n=1 Tax=Spiroplasma endosymbiont of Colias croceus TaxID=3066310 RepID=UPI0030CD20EF
MLERTLWILLIIVVEMTWILLIHYGIKYCNNDKIFGIFLITIPLPIIGTFIGCMIIYKSQHPEYKFWKILENKIKKIFKFKKIKNKIKNGIPNV